MPIYEYHCDKCNRRFSMLNRSFSEIKEPVCSHCGIVGGKRVMSPFRVHKSPNDFMGGMPAWDTMNDFNEDDPRSVADMLRRMKDDTGQAIGPEGEELLARLDAGEMVNTDEVEDFELGL